MAVGALASERLHAIAARLKAQGDRGTRLEMTRALRGAAQPLVTSVRAEARRRLPRSGGLAEEQADQAIRVSVLTGARSAGVRIRTRTPGSVQTNSGYVRHPVYGVWRPKTPPQQVPGARGWWSETMARGAPTVQKAVVAEMNRIARKIQGY